VVFGAEAVFRLRRGLRLGGGLLVMPALSYHYDDYGSKSSLTAGTLYRIPGVFEWEFAISDHISIVPGVIPSFMVLMHGEQAKYRAEHLCALGCEALNYSVNFAIEGELGAMWWINRQAVRTDVRFGYEDIQTVSVKDPPTVGEILTGLRMTLLLGFEI
jgi:hypothetical protein